MFYSNLLPTHFLVEMMVCCLFFRLSSFIKKKKTYNTWILPSNLLVCCVIFLLTFRIIQKTDIQVGAEDL